MTATIGKYIDWENLDWSKLNEHEKEMYTRMLDERSKQVNWNWIKSIAVVIPALFIVACTVNVTSPKTEYPYACELDLDSAACKVLWE